MIRSPACLAGCAAAIVALPALAAAQMGPIVLDGSLGPAGDVPFDPGLQSYQITDDLGEFSGDRSNLFHSFARFDVPAGNIAHFSSSETPQRVIARVTGNDVSDIDGTIRSSIPGADFFLLNPFGVLFGEEASVDVTGSFYATTADALHFQGDGQPDFTSRDATPEPLLASAAPRAFGFLVDTPADIALAGAQLAVREGQTLMLAGGDIDVQGRPGIQVPSLQATGGEVVIASVSSALEVPLDASQLDALALAPDALGDVNLFREAVVDVSSSPGGGRGSGRAVIRGGRIVLDRASVIVQAANPLSGAPTGVDIAASERLTLENASGVQSFSDSSAASGGISLAAPLVEFLGSDTAVASFATSPATGPAIRVAGGKLSMNGGARIATATILNGLDAGAIQVTADSVALDGEAQITSLTDTDGPGGAIGVTAGKLDVEGAAQITSENRSMGEGGAIVLDISDTLRIAGGGQISTRVSTTARGAGGALLVAAGSLLIETGTAASVSQLGALTSSTFSAPGGTLSVAADRVELRVGGQIRTTSGLPDGSPPGATPADGRAGDLTIDVSDAFFASGVSAAGSPSGVFARSAASSSGDGGNLAIAARNLELSDGAEISARSIGAGNAGTLDIDIGGRLRVAGGKDVPSTISARGDAGSGGDLSIDADVLELVAGGVISASTLGSGDSGNLVVNAREVRVSGANPAAESGLFAQTLSGRSDAGNAGDLRIEARELLHIEDSGRLSVASLGGGLAGDIEITGGGRVEVAGGEISARVADTRDTSGTADIRITDASSLILSDGTVVTAETSGTGAGGSVVISAVDIALLGGSEVTARSTSSAANAGDAGSITLDAARLLVGRDASLTTTARNAGGGQIALNAGNRLELLRSRIETTVSGANASADAGNIDIPLRALPGAPVPRAVVLNGSVVRANAVAANAGNITIAGGLVLRSQNSIVQAESELGVDGNIDAPEPNREIVGQLAVLPSNYVDATSLLATPCEARTERAGSFVIQRRTRIDMREDAPLSAELLADGDSTRSNDLRCSTTEEGQ